MKTRAQKKDQAQIEGDATVAVFRALDTLDFGEQQRVLRHACDRAGIAVLALYQGDGAHSPKRP